MKVLMPLLLMTVFVLAGCGKAAAPPSAFCSSVSAVKADVQSLKELKNNPSISSLETQLKQLNTDVHKAITAAKSSAGPEVTSLKSSVSAFKATLTQVKGKKVTIAEALPILKTQAQAVATAWTALTDVEKC